MSSLKEDERFREASFQTCTESGSWAALKPRSEGPRVSAWLRLWALLQISEAGRTIGIEDRQD